MVFLRGTQHARRDERAFTVKVETVQSGDQFMLPRTHRSAATATFIGAFTVLFFALLAPATVHAAVITFEGHGDDGAVVQTQEGFDFTFDAAGWGIFTDGFVGGGAPYTHDGTTRLVASGDRGGLTARVDFARTDAALFSLDGFDAATMFPGFRGRIEVIGDYGVGGSVSAFFDLSDSFTSFVLPATFAGLSTVHVLDTFSTGFRGNPGSFSLDNIVYDQVPEPATLALLGIALAGLGFSRRKQ